MARKLIDRGHEVTMLCGDNALGNTGVEGTEPVNRGRVDGIKHRNGKALAVCGFRTKAIGHSD